MINETKLLQVTTFIFIITTFAALGLVVETDNKLEKSISFKELKDNNISIKNKDYRIYLLKERQKDELNELKGIE